jgi:alkylation response protein AidB-like acyl-CoA dehydrogenase
MDRGLWRTVAELGWLRLGLGEDRDGLGLGLDALAVLYEEAGRALAPIPLLPTILSIDLLARYGADRQCDRWLGSMLDGTSIAAFSAPQDSPVAIAVDQIGGKLRLSGTDRHLLHGADADLLFLLARRSGGGLVRVVIEPSVDRVRLERRRAWDGTRSLATVEMTDVELSADRLIAITPETERAFAAHASVAIAADAIGLAAAALSHTVAYMLTREQFGRPIGSFQALKHRVANLQATLMGDIGLVHSAASLLASGDPLGPVEAAAAKAQVCRNAVELTRDAIQLHGGIGYTSEHVIHLYLMRARLDEALFGTGADHLDLVLDHLLGRTAA